MEDVQQIIIPTLSRAKISHLLSYPIGAEQISTALASTPQLSEIRLLFFSWRYLPRLRESHYEFLRVEYLNNAVPAQKHPIRSLYGRPKQGQWEIVVQPVKRVFRHRIKEYILQVALPQIGDWLVERAHLAQQGSDILAFFYDELGEEFAVHPLTNLEPKRR
jgi:hypothetical protein